MPKIGCALLDFLLIEEIYIIPVASFQKDNNSNQIDGS